MNSVSWEDTKMPIKMLLEWIVVFIGICGFLGTRSSSCQNGTFLGHCYRNEVRICFNGNLYQTTMDEIQKVDNSLSNFSLICNCTIPGLAVNCSYPHAFKKIVDHSKFHETLVLTGDTTTLSSTESHGITFNSASNENTVQNDATGVAMCPCNCEYFDKIEYWSQEANQIKQYNELSQQLAHIKNILKMETKNLTSYLKKKKSVNDKRPSARATGYVGGVILVLILCCIVLLDILKWFQ